MRPQSKDIDTLPAHLRAEVERRMAESGFVDYRGLAEWVREQGYEISDDSLWRYGKGIQRQLTAAQMAVHQARALAEVTADNKGFLIEAIMTVVEQKVLSKLLEGEQVENSDIRLLNAAANLARATGNRSNQGERVDRIQEPECLGYENFLKLLSYAFLSRSDTILPDLRKGTMLRCPLFIHRPLGSNRLSKFACHLSN